MATVFGVTEQGFVLKRLTDVLASLKSNLAKVQDAETGNTLNLSDENDPLMQLVNAVGDEISVCWEQLQMCYNQFIPAHASGAALSGLVQLNGLLRQTGETDLMLRLRQQLETEGTANGQIGAIYSAVAGLNGVVFCRAYQNTTIVTDDRGIPGKSLGVVVVGGDHQEIADTIFHHAPGDVGHSGNITRTCLDSLGIPYQVSFWEPIPVNIMIRVDVRVLDPLLWPQDGISLIKQAIVHYADFSEVPNVGLPPGCKIVISRLFTPVNLIPGHEIQAVYVSRQGDSLAPYNISMAWNEVPVINIDNIMVNLV